VPSDASLTRAPTVAGATPQPGCVLAFRFRATRGAGEGQGRTGHGSEVGFRGQALEQGGVGRSGEEDGHTVGTSCRDSETTCRQGDCDVTECADTESGVPGGLEEGTRRQGEGPVEASGE